jgi:uncharacterized membrane protein YkoI
MMIDKKILISIVIVLLIGVAAAGYQITTKTTGFWQTGVSQAQTPTDQGSSGVSSSGQTQTGSQSSSSGSSSTGGVTVKITSSQAKSIAQKSILETTASAGTPKLTTLDGKAVYNVPIVDKTTGKQVGELVINAQTGEIIEGAGGAP